MTRPHRAIALVFVVHGAVAGTLTTSVPWLQAHYRLGPAALGLALFCAPVGSFIAMPTANRIAHRYGARRTTRVLIALWAALLPAPVLAGRPELLFVAYLLLGMAAGSSDVLMNAQAVGLERAMRRPIISRLHGLWCLGSLAAGGVGILTAQQHIGTPLHLLVVAGLLVVLAAYAGHGLPADDSAVPGSGSESGTGSGSEAAPAPRRFALPTRAILAIGLLGFCATFAEGATSNWAGVYVTKVADAGPTAAATTYTLFMFSMTVTRLLGDRAVQRLGPVMTVRLGASIATCGGILVVVGRTPLPCMIGFALIGIGIAVNVPLVISAAGRTRTTPGEGVAGVATITYLSGLIAPAAIGWTAGAVSYPAAFALVTAMAATMTLLAGKLRPRPASPASPPSPVLSTTVRPAAEAPKNVAEVGVC